MEVRPVSSMSLNSVVTQSETDGINIEVEHLFENLKKAQAATQHFTLPYLTTRFPSLLPR